MNRRQKLVQQQFLNDEEAVIKRLKIVYNQSLKDINKKVFELDSSISMLQKALDSIDGDEIGDLALAVLKGKSYYTPAEAQETIKSMLQSKVYQKNYQKALQKQVSDIMDKMQAKEYKAVADYLNECYENGFIGTMYDLQGQGIPLCFPLDQEQMVRAVQLDSKISKGLYSRLGEDISLLKKKIAAQVSRGISTGMSYQQVAQQLAGVSNIGFNNAVRIARTEGHRIQCQAGMDACEKAKEKGADVVKQWDATLDGVTRESHAMVDGEIRELDKPFSNGLMFPGDPNGGAAEVINCRCALLQRARWALDEAELETLKERAAFFGLDKTKNYEEYKNKYLQAQKNIPEFETLDEYLLEKKKWLKDHNYDIYGDTIEEMEKGFWEEAADGSMAADASWLKAINQKINSLVTKQAGKGDKIEMGNLLEASKLGATHGKAMQDIISNAPKNAKSVWNKYAKRLDVEEAHEPKGKAFCNYTKGITCDIDKVAKGEKGIYGFDASGKPIWKEGKKPYYTAFHEFGHNISALMCYDKTGNKFGSISTTFQSKKYSGMTLHSMIMQEGKAYFNSIFDRLKAEAKAKGLSARTVRHKQAWDIIKAEILAHPTVECSDISDMWDGISNGSCLAHYGHTNKDKQYWSKISVGEEAFAEMFSATVMNPESVEHIKHYFPKTYEIFEEILKELG